jgi:hypothetical protein
VASEKDVKGYATKALAEAQAVAMAQSLIAEQQLPMGVDDA